MKILLTSDWHIRSDQPLCRLDDFQETQKKTLKEIRRIYVDSNCDYMIVAGDIFHRPRPIKPQELEVMISTIFKGCNVKFIAGNHELLWHKFENFGKSSLAVLNMIPGFELLDQDSEEIKGFSFGIDIKKSEEKIAVIHKFCSENKLPFFINDGVLAKDLIEYGYDLVVTGDNHKTFTFKKDGCFVINPGCITRQNVGEIDYKPSVYIYSTDKKYPLKFELLDNKKSVIDTSHIENKKDRDARIESFVKKISGNVDIDLSYEENLKKYIADNKISKKVENKIFMALEDNDG
jgi:DNA repair exonuclease SbcCD nuclease subunit